MKKVLTAGLALAAAVAFGDSVVTNSSELTGQTLDTRTEMPRSSNRFDDILPFVYIDDTTITVTCTNDGSTVEFVGAIDSTTNWVPSTFGFFAATNGSLSAAFWVNQLVCDFSFDDGTDEFDYQFGAEVRPAFTLKDGDYTLQKGIDYTAVYSNNINPGTATLTITGIGKYWRMDTVVKTFTIRPASVSDSSQAGTLDTRTDPVREANRFDDILPFVYIDDTTITVTRTNDGSTVEFVGAIDSTTNCVPSNFGFFAATNGSLSAAFRFDRLVCEFSFDDGTDEFDYQFGAEVRPAFTLRDGDYTLQEGTDYTAVYSNNINPGTATLTITGIGKYTLMGTVVKTFKIRPASVSDSSKTGTLDTRTGESRILNGVAELQAFAYNNVPGWPKGGDTDAAAATVRMTPMIGVAGGVVNWLLAGVPYTLATDAGENTLNWTPTDGFTCYKAEMLIGGELVETAYLNLNGADFEGRATVTVIGGEAMTVSVTTNDGQTLTGELTYRWYVYNPTNTWYEGLVSTDTTFTPGPAHYEKAMRVLVFDDRGYAGMTEQLWCSKLPVVYIDTDGVPVVSKDIDVAATMRLQGNARFTDKKQLYDGEMTMHVRGNQTSNAEKKPYKIKLDSKANLLGLSVDGDGEASKNKHWVLLANAFDFSLLRNKTAYDLSGAMGLTYMASEWVDVVMNGEYVGNYQLCEHIRVGEDRVDIYDWEDRADKVADEIAATNGFTKAATKDLETYLEQNLGWVTAGEFTWTNGETYVLGDYGIDTNEFDISGGYIFELDYSADEVTMFYTGTPDKRIYLLTKVNRPEYLNSNDEMLDFAKLSWSNYWSACVSPDGYYQGVHYTQMSSIDSMVAYWLTQTIMGQRDNNRSRYAYKPVDDLLQWGPAWDFDHSCGGPANWTFDASGAILSRFDSRSGWEPGVYSTGADTFYREWIDDPYFVLKAFEKLNEMKGYLDNLVKAEGLFAENVDYIFESGVANADRWAGRITQGLVISPFMRFDGENGDVAWFRENLTSRIAWIRNQFRSIRAAVASLKTNNSKNPYSDSADKFAFDFVTPHVLRPVEGEGEGATPDIMLSNASNLETRVTLTGLTAPATVDVYVNGLSNGTYAVESDTVAFTVNSNEFTNVDGHRNMISLVAKNASGTKLATTYSLVTTINEANYPQQISNATVVVHIDAEVPFTGAPYTPEVTITIGEGPDAVTLVAGEDYKVEYVNNTYPGAATVRITGLGNLYGTGEFPRGNWVGTVEKTFTIHAEVGPVASDELTGQALDTRTDLVRTVESAADILPVAWNNTEAWTAGGDADGSAPLATATEQLMEGDVANPAAWTAKGELRELVSARGEGTNRVSTLANGLHTFTLKVGGETKNVAYFDLEDTVLAALEESFAGVGGATAFLDDAGTVTNYLVSVTNGATRTIDVPAGISAPVTLDLAGNTLSGTNGVNGSATVPGTDGAPALTVGTGTTLVVKDSGDPKGEVKGGNGGDGSVGGQGAKAIDGAYTTEGDVAITDGEDGSVIKSDDKEALEEAFDGIAEVEALLDEAGNPTNYVVTVTNSNEGTIEIPADINLPVTLDLAGQTLAGTNGVNGSATVPGTDGAPAITVGDGTTLVVKDSGDPKGAVKGGNGGDGSVAGQGAKAIDGEYVTDGSATISDGTNGTDLRSDAQKALEEAFKPNAYVEPMTNTEGQVTNYNVVVTNDITGPVIVPENVNEFVISLNDHSITGAVGEAGSEATAGGDGTAAIVVSNAAAQVSVKGPGSITGGNGGAGNPPAEGAEAIVTSAGVTVEPVSVTDATVEKGADGADLKTDEQKELEEAFKPNAVVTPVTNDVGEVTNYNVVVTNDITGPVIVPENVAAFIVDLDGHSITGKVGAAGSEGVPGGEGTAAIVVSNEAAQVSVKGPGSITGGNGGAGNPPGEGAEAIVTSAGVTVDPVAVTDGATVSKGADGADLKTEDQKELEEAFKPNAYVEPMTNAEGQVTNYNVVVTNDITGPVIVPADVEVFIIDLGGHSITGAAGEDGSPTTEGHDGTAAIVVSNAAAKVSVKGPGSITGGNGGLGNPPGEGAEAIVTSAGAKVDPVAVTDGATVTKGATGEPVRPCSVEIDKVLPRTPWSGDIEVRYTCTDLRAGFSYKEIFHVTVNGVEKCVTNAVPVLDVGYASLSKSFVIHGEELFGLNVKDSKAKVNIELVPVPPAE